MKNSATNFEEFGKYRVLVLERTHYPEFQYLNRFVPKEKVIELLELISKHYTFINHEDAELTPSLKQLVLHIVIEANNKYLIVRRDGGNKSAPELRDKFIFGIQGHVVQTDIIQPQQTNFLDLLENAARRKILDELETKENEVDKMQFSLLGVINDESEIIGTKHWGIVFKLQLQSEILPKQKLDIIIRKICYPSRSPIIRPKFR